MVKIANDEDGHHRHAIFTVVGLATLSRLVNQTTSRC